MKLHKIVKIPGGGVNSVVALLAFTISLAATTAQAADRTFPSAGGDLASSSDWGGTLPGTGDNAIINQAGTYTLSDDVTFGRLRVKATGCTFNFSGHKQTAALFVESVANAYTIFSGGCLDIKSGEIRPAYSADGINTVFTNGCIITNAATFFAARECSNAKTEIAGGTKAYVGTLRILEGGSAKVYGHDNTLEIYDGGQLYVTNRIYSDVNMPAVTEETSHGGQRLVVRGDGSVLNDNTPISGYLANLGYSRGSNTFRFSDNAYAYFRTGVSLNAGRNSLLVENCATCNLVRVKFNSSDNIFSVSNAVLYCSRVQSGNPLFVYDATASNNIFRVYGADTSLSLGVNTGDFFGDSNSGYNTVSFEGGAVCGLDGNRTNMMARTHHSTFRITGAGTTVGTTGRHFYIGDTTTDAGKVATINSVSNRLEVLDGATFMSKRLPVMGVANTVCISNATVNLGGNGTDNVGLRVGYNVPNGFSNSTNCVLVLQGATPKVEVQSAASDNSACWFANGSTLRFEIPKEGYAKDFVPLTTNSKFLMDTGSKLEIDCAQFVAHTGGKLHLIHADGGIVSDAKTAINACASTLPEGCEIIVEDEDVYIKSRKCIGFVLMYK